ncbi:MAG: hypothetical protein GF393_12910, partial [Armatimonadia bacterium]|nr:hypothetical protein [Armatimonadia bacterium]
MKLLSSLWLCFEEEMIEEEPPIDEIELDEEGGGVEDPADGGGDGGSAGDSGDTGDQPYYGSKELNPENRPLRIDVSDMTQEEIDFALQDGGAELFLTDEEIAAKKGDAEPDEDEGEESEEDDDTEEEKPEEKDDSKKKASGGDEDDVKEFFESTGLDRETFNNLPEKTQEKLVSLYQSPAGSEDLKKVQQEYSDFRSNIEKINGDPVIAARLEEMATGQSHVARDVPPITVKEMDEVDSLL